MLRAAPPLIAASLVLVLAACGPETAPGGGVPGASDPGGVPGVTSGSSLLEGPGVVPAPRPEAPALLAAPLEGSLAAGVVRVEVLPAAGMAEGAVPVQIVRSSDGLVLVEVGVHPGSPVELDLAGDPEAPSGTWVTVTTPDDRAEVLLVDETDAHRAGRHGPMRYSDLGHAVAMTLVLPTCEGRAVAALSDDSTGELVAETEFTAELPGQARDGMSAFRGWLVLRPAPNHAFSHVPPRGTPMTLGTLSADGHFEPIEPFRWGSP